ncbi:nucleotidyltransferase family protein [Mucilaginibacter ginkgonis]|uniref:Nucleotidyltransferase domain-containing protein n=1 Tax=Mucilaginibacter ginkgonis TaxID=2682091 RepID=A0A6I4I125_9SPHI|nr:nucleotidyltransferase domain-containing protein [Mucilaginibacter ginkgonis]QQL48820.1 nucleotidyltransferase domain-containing protein [Mucilaginibacter ginkgonis]
MDAIVADNLEEIKLLMQKHGVVKASLFGSAAKDTMTAESDVDFLVNFDSGLSIAEYGDNYFELIYALENLLQREVEIIAEKTLSNPYLIESINNSKVSLL